MKCKTAALGLVACGLLFLPAPAAQAQEGAWCGYEGGRNSYENCSYPSLRSCVESMRGLGGACRPNPRGSYRRPYDDEPPPPRRRRYRRD